MKRHRRLNMRPQTEALEDRTLLSAATYEIFDPDFDPKSAPPEFPIVDLSYVLGPGGGFNSLILAGDSEPNNSPGTAQAIPGFGTGPGDDPAADITGNQAGGFSGSVFAVAEPGDSIGTATPTGVVTGNFSAFSGASIGDGAFGGTSGDFDFYSVTAAAGQEILVEVDTDGLVSGPASLLDPLIGIYDAAGNLLYHNDDHTSFAFFFAGSFDSSARFVTPAAGTYYVAVGGFTSLNTPGSLPADPTTPGTGPGAGSTGAYDIVIGLDAGDQDFYSVQLEAGDILGANLSSFASLSLRDPSGAEVIGSFFDLTSIYPTASPLPGGGVNAAFVAPVTGTYTVGVSLGVGAYNLNLRAFRPVLETESAFTRQVLYLDFDGATVNPATWGGPNTVANLSPLSSFLGGWGLTAGDEDAVIDAIIASVVENLASDVSGTLGVGNNGDFFVTGTNGDFGIQILNSRDHADPFGLYDNVSRVIFGGTIAQLGISTIGIAESIDIGNFDTSEDSVVLLDLLSASAANPNSLNQFALDPSVDIIDLIGVGVGNIGAHEAGHFFASFHRDQQFTAPSIMDQGGNLANTIGLIGPVWGDGDEIDVDFGTDIFVPNEGLTGGADNNLQALAFNLSTGLASGVYFDFVDGVVHVSGTTNNGTPDTYRLVVSGGTDLEVFVNGVSQGTTPLALINSIEVHGSGDDDLLVVDHSAGVIARTINFTGSGQVVLGDELRVIGNGSTTGTYTPSSTTNGNGTATVNGNAINFTGLEPVEISAMVSYTFATPNAADDIQIVNATGSGGEPAIQVTGTSGGVGFEVPTFFDITNLTIDAAANDGGAIADNVLVDFTNNILDIVTLRIETGAGNDTINVGDVGDLGAVGPANGLVEIIAGIDDDTINVGGPSSGTLAHLEDIDTVLDIDGGTGSDSLVVDDSSHTGIETYTITNSTIDRTSAFAGLTYSGLDDLDLLTSENLNTVNVQSLPAGMPTFIEGNSSDDLFNVAGAASGATTHLEDVQSPLTINGNGGINDTIVLDDFFHIIGEDYIITPTTVTRTNGFGGLTYGTVELLQLETSSDADNVTVTPSATTAFDLEGNAPATLPGDVLVYDGTGDKAITGPSAGTITGVGVQPVVFSEFENIQATAGNFLNDIIDLTTLPGGQDGNPNSVSLTLDPTGTLLQVFYDSNTGDATPPLLLSSQLYTSVNSVTVTGGTDTDTLIVDHSNGFLGAGIGFDGGIQFNGNGGVDSLVITGTPTGGLGANARETYIVGATEDAGTWIIDPDGNQGPGAGLAANGDEMTINFTGLEPADSDTVVPVFDVVYDAADADDISIVNGGLLNGFNSLQVNDESGTFETFRFANKTTTRLHLNGGIDAVVLDYSIAADMLTTLEVYGNGAAGVAGVGLDDNSLDYFLLRATAAGVQNNLFGQGGDDIFENIGAGPFLGLPVPFGTFDLSNINGSVSMDGGTDGANGDLIALSDVNAAAADMGTLTNTTLVGVAPATLSYGTVETFYLELTGLNDVLDVTSTQAGTSYILTGDGGSDTITIGNETADFSVNPDGSLNSDGGSLDAILGPISIVPDSSNGPLGGNDIINVDDSGTAGLFGNGDITNTGADTITIIPGATITGTFTTLTNFAPAPIRYAHTGTGGTFGIGTVGNRLEQLNIFTSDGTDTIAVNHTTAIGTTRIDMHDGDDNSTMTINGDGLAAANIFHGSAGVDEFILNITAHLGAAAFVPITSLEIWGDDTNGDSDMRDRLIINDFNTAFVRNLNYDYLDAGGLIPTASLDIRTNAAGAGLAGPVANIDVNLRSMETVLFNSDGVNDLVTVTGTSDDDVITVAAARATPAVPANGNIGINGITAANSAFVFLGGDPYLNLPGAVPAFGDSLAENYPGLAGGGTGPDLLIDGVNAAIGIRVDGEDADNNRVVYQAASVTTVGVDGEATNYWGLGAGILIPGFGPDNAFDDININNGVSGANRVTAVNNAQGPLLPIELINLPSFTQNLTSGGNPAPPGSPRPALIVNGGDEGGVRTTGPLAGIVADDFFVTVSNEYFIQVNGNLPPLGLGTDLDGFPIGDQLNATGAGSVNIWSDKQSPPNVNFTFGNNPFGITYSSIERMRLLPTNGVVNLIGDNNDPGVDQTDNFVVRGRDIDPGGSLDAGFQEMTVQINGSSPILIDNVQDLNVYGYDLAGEPNLNSPNPLAPDNPATGATADDIDTLDISAYADDTPLGWGIDVFYNEGSPAGLDGDQADLLIVHTSLFGGAVSEDIVVRPSGPDNGEVVITNGSFGTPIVDIDYVGNTDIIVLDDDGFLNDTDTLTLLGTNPDNPNTSGLEDILVDLTAAGDAANPLVQVFDSQNDTLYNLRNFVGFNTLNIDTLGGSDFVSLIGADDGSVTLNVNGGPPTGAGGSFDIDTVEVEGTTDANDDFLIVPGASSDSGRLEVLRDSAAVATVINFTTVEQIAVDGGGGTGDDILTIEGTGHDDVFALVGTGGTGGNAQVNDGPAIEFFSLGSDASEVNLNGGNGDDEFSVTYPALPWDISAVNVDGGDPTGSDTLIVNGVVNTADAFVYTPTDSDSGTVANDVLPVVNFTDVEHVEIDGQNDDPFGAPDTLTIDTQNIDGTNVLTPGSTFDSGNVEFRDGTFGTSTAAPLSFRRLGAGGNLIFDDVFGRFDDLIYRGTDLDDTFDVDANGQVLLNTQIAVDTPGINVLTLAGLDGDDTFNVVGNHNLLGIAIQGGGPSASDVLNFAGDGGAITVNLENATITEGNFAPVSFSGVETINIDADTANVSFVGRAADDDITVSPTGANAVSVSVAGINTVFQISAIGAFDVDGMGGDNELTVRGTTAGEIIDVDGDDVAVENLQTVDYANIDALTIQSRQGQDTVNVTPSATTPIHVVGGTPVGELQQPVGDILNVITGGLGFTFLPGPEPDSGTFAVANQGPISFDEIERLQVNGVDYILPDRFDDPDLILPPNDSIAAATNLGSEPTTIEQLLTLHDTGVGINEDFFKITAHDTGKMIFNVFFEHAMGDIDIEILDMSGDVVFQSNGVLAQGFSATDNEQVIIPVVAQEMYFLRVFSADGSPNIYNLEIENFAAPRPDQVHLDPADDTGMMANDGITSETQPRFIIQADLQDFADMGIAILTPAQALANLADEDNNPFPGAAVEVHIISSTTGLVHDAPVGAVEMLDISGFATMIGVSNILFEFTPTNPLPDDTYFVTAAVRIFDGQTAPDAHGRSRLSVPLWFTVDTTAPKGMVLESFSAFENDAATSAGVSAQLDLNPAGTRLDVTVELAQADLGGQTPAFTADNVVRLSLTDDTNTVVFDLLTNGIIDAANSRVGVQITNPALAALLDDLRAGLLNVEVELAGGTVITADLEPNGFPLKLLQSSDTGMSLIDEVTNKMSPAFLVKAEANAKVRIFARNVLTGAVNQVGNGAVGSDTTDGVVGNGFGLAEITVEPMGDGSYEFFAEFEDLAGNISRHYDFAATGLPAAIPDSGTVEVEVNVAGLFGSITDLDLTLDVTHANLSELSFTLTSPEGTTVVLIMNDLAGANLTGTILDDEAAASITTGTAPYSGRFQLSLPANTLSDFDGEDPTGTWTLTVTDNAAGNTGTVDDFHLCILTNGGLPVEIDTLEPNTAQLNVLASSDSGRNDEDNVTFDNTPTVSMTTTDPNSAFHLLFTDNLKFRIYDRHEGNAEFLLYDSARDPQVDAITTPGDMFTSLQLILETLPEQYFTLIGTNTAVLNVSGSGVLADGVHELKLEVEDRAGNISHDFLLTLIVDTLVPPVSFGLSTSATDGLTPESDSGKEVTPSSLTDNVTNVTNPTFWGRAEANSTVRLHLDVNGNGVVDAADIFLGQDTAIPLDGNDAEPDGYWEITTVVGLNDPQVIAALGLDGLRQILITAEDRAGNVNQPNDGIGDAGQSIQIFIDTQGPVVFDPDGIGPRQAVEVGGAVGYNLLAPILGQGPTPPITSLIINLEDLPARVAQFLYGALDLNIADDPDHYRLVGDRQGIISIDDLIVMNLPTAAGQPARATVELRFDQPLADDRYTLTLFDELVDPACNALDGESRASSPTGDALVRSGDGVPGGDFVARFTVDSRVEIASVGQAVVQVDINGNFVFDPSTGDFVNRDQSFGFGLPTDAVFVGQFSPPGVPSDGYDRFGAYGFVNGAYRWLLDFNNDSIPDYQANSILQINAIPFSGDFIQGNGRDEIGLFDGNTWYIDVTNDNNIGPGDVIFTGNMQGLPITGDFDGDGLIDLATHVASTNTFFFDLSSANPGGAVNGIFDATLNFGFGGVLERPFAGDFNLDGVTDVGLTVPSQNSNNPTVVDWYVIMSNPAAITIPGTVNQLATGFFPEPGVDVFTQFGSNNAVPLVGNFRAAAPQFSNVTPGAGVVGADAGGGPHVRVFNNATGQETLSFFAYTPSFTGGVRVASGDVNGDNVADIITGPGPGGGPHVRVFDGRDGTPIREIMAFNPIFSGGVNVASADVNMDGFADIIVGADAGGGPHVMVFSGLDNSVLASIMAFDATFAGGVSVAGGDVDMDGFGDIIVGAGAGGGPHVKVFSGLNGAVIRSFFAYNPIFTGGVRVAAGDLNSDGFADIITGPGVGGGPHIRAFSGQTGADLLNFLAFDPFFTGGVRVGAGDVNLDGQVDVFVTTGAGTSPIVRVISGTGIEIGSFTPYGPSFTGGAFVAGGAMPGETLHLAGNLGRDPNASALTDADLANAVSDAISRYEAAGLGDDALALLAGTNFAISDLAGQQLGLAQGNTILIDVNAAGRGWFVDATPGEDEEFRNGLAIAPDAQGKVDLLSVVLHELGHRLDLPELYAETGRVMGATIRTGQRRLPTPDDLDDVFASGSLFETLDLN